MPPITTRPRWGAITAFLPVTTLVGGLNTVISNVGVAIQIYPGAWAQRVTQIGWRIDLAPDVTPFTLASPIRWRVFIGQGQVPDDISAFQQQAFGATNPPGARLEIPFLRGGSTSIAMLHDEWLDFGCGAPGLNKLFTRDFADGGPSVAANAFLCAILCPLIDAQFPITTSPNPTPAFAQMTLEMWGTSATAGAFAGDPFSSGGKEPSYPRF